MEAGGQTKLLVRPMTERDLPETASLERLSFSVPWTETLLSECLDSRLDLVWVLEEERGSELQKGEGRKKIAGYLYKSYGFVEEAVRKSYYTEPVEDAVIMGLRLS